MKKIQDIAAIVFLSALGVLSVVSILGVWEFFGRDVITKSFETIGFLAVISIIVMISGYFFSNSSSEQTVAEMPNPLFKNIRHASLTVLIVSLGILAVLGVLAIWEVMSKEVLHKSISSVAILAFLTLVSVLMCLQREGTLSASYSKNQNSTSQPMGAGKVLLIILAVLFGIPFMIGIITSLLRF